jgi:predicted alpha/beta-hydrolase family hydrolase
VALPAGALGALLLHRAASAAVSAPLVAATVRAATLLSAGGAETAGALSANVLTLLEGAGPAMCSTKSKIVAAVLAAAGLLAAGVGVAARREAAAPPPDSPPARAAQPPGKAGRPPAAPDEGPVVVSGRVVGPDGKPVAGARLYWPHLRREEPRDLEDVDFPQRGTTDREGRFRLELPRADVRPDLNVHLVALADGYGVAGAELPKGGAPAELTLRLVKDQPIRGRVRNTEGQPLAGVRVTLVGVRAPVQGGLDGFLAAWKRDWEKALQLPSKEVYVPGNPSLSVKTDKDGRFQIAGAGAERIAPLQVEGHGIARTPLWVLTRPGLDPAPFNRAALEGIAPELRIPGQPPLLYGPTFEYVATPTRVIEGTVREAGTGRPVPGIMVSASAGYCTPVYCVTDAKGRYRLVGLPKQKHLLHAEPEKKSTWLSAGARVPDTEGLQPLTVDFELARGVVLTGRLIDRATGKGVKGGLRYAPLPGNKYFGRKGYDSYRYERFTHETDAQGRFRLVVIPGPGVLLAQAYGGNGRYRQATIDPADRRRVPVVSKDGDRYFTAADNSLECLTIEHACKVLDLKEDAGTASYDLFVDAGRTLTVSLQGPDGKPLPRDVVDGVMNSWPGTLVPEKSACALHVLDPEIPRQVVFYHPGRQLAGRLTVRGDEKEPPVVRLAPTGTVTGRVLDLDGRPLPGADVHLWSPDDTVRDLFRLAESKGEPVRTDKDGRFRLGGLVPDMKLGFQIYRGKTFLVSEPRVGPLQVGPGKTQDLGDFRTRPYQP